MEVEGGIGQRHSIVKAQGSKAALSHIAGIYFKSEIVRQLAIKLQKSDEDIVYKRWMRLLVA